MKYLLAIILGLLSANFIFSAEKIDINTASPEDLMKIIHIGEVRARELISLRPFSSLDELTRIKGIGEARLADIKEQGLAWIAPATVEPAEDGALSSLATTSQALGVEPQPINYPEDVIINEILPSPIGADEKEEWIEIFNKNNFEVDLSGWRITDKAGTIEIYIFPGETIIGPNDFLVFYRPTTKITLNNRGDGLKLIQPNKNIIDEINYEEATRGESYSRFECGWVWTSAPTPRSANTLPAPSKKTAEDPLTPQALTAAAAESLQLARNNPPDLAQGKKTFSPLSAAIFIAIFSGVIIFILKRRLAA